MIPSLMQLLGLAGVLAFLFILWWPLALGAGGAILFLLGWALDRSAPVPDAREDK